MAEWAGNRKKRSRRQNARDDMRVRDGKTFE